MITFDESIPNLIQECECPDYGEDAWFYTYRGQFICGHCNKVKVAPSANREAHSEDSAELDSTIS